MRALQLIGYGSSDKLQLHDVPTPQSDPGQVLIRVHYAGLNPVDYKIRDGKLKAVLPLRFPQTMGNEVSGEIAAVGSGVDRFKPGDRVFVRLAKESMGGFADHVVTDANLVAKLPDNLSLKDAAGVPLVALTAWQCLFEYGQADEHSQVLIHAGAGAVGRVAVQLATHAGARVATTVSDRGMSVARTLGAEVIINYKKDKFENAVRNYDFVLDTVGGDTLNRSFDVLKRGGKLCSITATPEARTAADLNRGPLFTGLYGALFGLMSLPLTIRGWLKGVDYRFVFMRPDGEQLQQIADLIEAGKLRFESQAEYALEDYAAAFDDLEQAKTSGKIVFRMT